MAERVRDRFYYGWVIVLIIALVGWVQTAGFDPTIGLFIEPITDEFGWSRSAFVGAASAGSIAGGLLAMMVGPALDRFGPRLIMPISLLFLGGGLIGLAFVEALWQFYIAMIVARMIIMGPILLSSSVIVSKWFVRLRGRAVGLSGLGVRIGIGVTPLYAQAIVGAYDWRVSLFVLGLIVWGVAMVPALLFLRRQPEDMGLRPDGARPAVGPVVLDASEQDADELSFTLKETLRTPAFYLVILGMAVGGAAMGGINVHLFPYLVSKGLSEGNAVVVMAVSSFVGIGSSVVAGLIAERSGARRLFSFSFVGLAIAVLLLLQVDNLWLAMAFGVLFGAMFGSMITMNFIILPEYFGRRYLGSIRGLFLPMQITFSSLGPLGAAAAYDVTDGYTLVFSVFVAFHLLAALAIFMARRPTRPAAQQPERAGRRQPGEP